MAQIFVLIDNLRAAIESLEDSREKSLALTKLDECRLWLEHLHSWRF